MAVANVLMANAVLVQKRVNVGSDQLAWPKYKYRTIPSPVGFQRACGCPPRMNFFEVRVSRANATAHFFVASQFGTPE
jgi:hypothetical protein